MKRLQCLAWRFLLTGSMLAAGSVAASASPCVTGSLQSYINLDQTGGCSIGGAPDNVFLRFDFSSSSTGNATVANASQITVTPINNSTSFGLEFSASSDGTNLFSTPAGSSVTYYINYSVDPLTSGPDLRLDPVIGDVSATQAYCLNDVFSSGCKNGVTLSQTVTNSDPPGSLSSQVPWPVSATTISLIDVNTTITLNGPASFDALDATFSTTAAPEPENFQLAGFGLFLVLIGIYAKRRSLIHRSVV